MSCKTDLVEEGRLIAQVDFYNMLLNDRMPDRQVPPILKPYMLETRSIMHHIRDVVQRKLLILLAMSLEVPEDELLATHLPGACSSEYYRYVSKFQLIPNILTANQSGYSPLSEEKTVKARGLFMPGHADWGTFSILFSQTIAALQVLDYRTGNFKWVQVSHLSLHIRQISQPT